MYFQTFDQFSSFLHTHNNQSLDLLSSMNQNIYPVVLKYIMFLVSVYLTVLWCSRLWILVLDH